MKLSIFRAEFFSPRDFVIRALFLSALFLIAHLAGLREFTSLLSGTNASPELGWEVSAFLGLIYIGLYFAFVLLVPVLLLAAALLWIRQKIRS